MRRFLTICFATLLFLMMTVSAYAGTWRTKECRFRSLDGRSTWSVLEVKKTIHCAAVRFGISESMAMSVAAHESGFIATAGTSYCGVYQHSRSAFPGRLVGAASRWPKYAWYGKRCENARSNIFAAFDLVKDTGGWEAHWCRWTTYC